METDANEKVLVHTKDQWAEKGCITIKHDICHNELLVRFHYWDSYTDKAILSEDDTKHFVLKNFNSSLMMRLLSII